MKKVYKPSYKPNYKFDCDYCGETNYKWRNTSKPKPRFCNQTCYGLDKRTPFVLKNGYKLVIKKGHPRANDHGYVREHILVMEEKLGRLIPKGESIHHIDGVKTNNHPDNLQLFTSHTEHLLHHWRENSLRKTRNGESHLSY